MADETKTLAWQLVVDTKGIEESTKKAAGSLQTLANATKVAGAAIASIIGVRELRMLMDWSDEMTRTSNQLRQVTNSTAEFDAVMKQLRASAQDTGVPLETAVTNYRALKQALDGYGVSTDTTIKLTNTAAKMIQLAGGSAKDTESNIASLALAFNQGTLVQRQFGYQLREMPALAKALSDSLGISKSALFEMVSAGKLTGKELIKALSGAADEIDSKWAQMAPTFARSFTRVRNALMEFLEEFEKSTGFFTWLSEEISKFAAEDIPALVNEFRELKLRVTENFEVMKLEIQQTWEVSVAFIKNALAQIVAAVVDRVAAIVTALENLNLADVFRRAADAVVTFYKTAYDTVASWMSRLGETIIGALTPISESIGTLAKLVAINYRESFELAWVTLIAFFKKSYFEIKEWLGKIGAYFASAIPDWIPGAEKTKKFFAGMQQGAKESAESITLAFDLERAKIEDKFANMRLDLGPIPGAGAMGATADAVGKVTDAFSALSEIKFSDVTAGLRGLKDQTDATATATQAHLDATNAKWDEAITKTREYQKAQRDAVELQEIVVTLTKKEWPPRVEKKTKDSVDEFAKALAALKSEYDKITLSAAAVAYEIEHGSEAAKDYKIAMEMTRSVEEKIATLRESKAGLTDQQAAALRQQAKANTEAAIAAGKLDDDWKRVKATMDAGLTPMEKLNKQLAGIEASAKRLDLKPEQWELLRQGMEEARRAGDPVLQMQEDLKQQATLLAIETKALGLEYSKGEAVGKAYRTGQLAQLELDKKLADLRRQKVDPAVIAQLESEAKALQEQNEHLARNVEAWKLVSDATTLGRSKYENAQISINKTRAAIERMYAEQADPAKIAAAEKGLRQMERSANELYVTFEGAVESMGSSLVNMLIDGSQSFSEWAANSIKEIGRVIAQMYMLKAIKMAFGMPFAQGGAFEHGRELAFQHGGVVAGPTSFSLAGGARGLMGEAGPEAVMPLARLPGGDLGVRAEPRPLNLEVINQTGVNATARVSWQADRTQLILEAAELGATMAQSRFNSSVASGYGASATNMQRTYGLTRRKA